MGSIAITIGSQSTNTDLSSDLGFSHELAQTLQMLLGELIGTFLVMLIAAVASIVANFEAEYSYIATIAALISVTITMVSLNHITWHFNPAVTIGLAFLGKLGPLSFKQVLIYIGAQILGCVVAIGFLSLLGQFGKFSIGFANPVFITEFIFSASLLVVLIFCSSLFQNHHRLLCTCFSWAVIVMIIVVNTSIFRTNTDASTSTTVVRGFVAAILKDVYGGLLIYIIAPTFGCILVGLVNWLIKNLDQLPSLITR